MQSSNEKFKSDLKRRIYLWTLTIIKLLKKLPKNYVFEVLGKQLLRSGSSILANFVEAQAASSRKDFTNFINHSLKSANESKVWLSLIKDSIGDEQIKKDLGILLKESIEISNILGKTMTTLRNK
jgi:four helix bundle protein